MKAILLCLYFAVFSCVLYAQSTLIEGQSAIGKGLWAQNTAGLSHSTKYALGISNDYSFGLSELSTSTISAIAPLKFGNVAVKWSQEGDHIFSKNELGLSFARYFSSYLQLGMGVRLNSISIDNESRSSLVADIGMQSAITQHISFGVQLNNPLRDEFQSTSIDIGIAYWLSEKTSLLLTSRKETDLPTSLILHINYAIFKSVIIQGAFSNNAFFNHFAITYSIRGLSIDAFLSHNSYLGYSPKVGISYSFGK